ncbi:MAG: hypothetical protein DCF32_04385 [Leptolyngbya sp.]|nr:MAG: hypothetical protein DCF32_04385 [Leptolyngbya sp.]
MDYRNRLKGAVTQALKKSLLIDAGYHVVPLGIEDVIREVNLLDKKNYLGWNLPAPLRKMPDFFVVDKDYKRHYLVEVKYRRVWDEAAFKRLYQGLLEQVRCWGNIFLLAVSCDSNNPSAAETPAQFIRCAVLSNEIETNGDMLHIEGKDPATDGTISMYLDERYFPEWNYLYRAQEVFGEISRQGNEQTLEKTKEILKGLRNLDVFD